MRIVCWFRCGAASAVATKLAITQNAGKLPLIVARCIVEEEHPDNNRFALDCEKWFGAPILNLTNEKYGGSVYKVIQARKYISGVQGAPCTMLLKKDVRIAFQLPTDRHVFGYCYEEKERFDAFLDANNIDVEVPLIDRELTHANTLAMIEDAGIRLPEMYRLGYQHNNCIGCVKATGAGYWNKIKKDFPIQFWRMAGASRVLGVKMTRIDGVRVFLDELPEGVGRYQDEPEIQCGIFCAAATKEITSSLPPTLI